MLIPVRCMGCGNVISDKYHWYIQEVKRLKIQGKMKLTKTIYLTEFTKSDKTPEGLTMDKLGLTKPCCRKHILTHVDI